MAYDFDKPLLTLAEIKAWQEEKTQLERQIRALQEQVSVLNRKLDAASVFVQYDIDDTTQKTEELFKNIMSLRKGGDDGLAPMTEAVEEVLREAPRPMKRAELKKALEKLGYHPKRLGNYFYTCLARLQAQERITRNGDLFAVAGKRLVTHQNDEAPSTVG